MTTGVSIGRGDPALRPSTDVARLDAGSLHRAPPDP